MVIITYRFTKELIGDWYIIKFEICYNNYTVEKNKYAIGVFRCY